MSGLLVNRLLQVVPTLVVTSALMFFVLSMGPSPMAQLQEFGNLSAEDVAALAHERGWDRPLVVQYSTWLADFARGDWGESVRTLQPASDMILERLPLTFVIAGASLALSVGIGVPLGALVAARAYSRIDYATTFMTLALMAVPGFFLAILLQIFAVQLRGWTGDVVFYTSGVPDEFSVVEWTQRLALPVLTLALTHIAAWVRYQRGELLQALGEQYVLCARAKGLPERVIFIRHAWRNAVLPIVTLVALDLGKLLAGAVIVESVFGLPGIGTLLLDSVVGHDTVVVLDILMIVALAIVVCTTLADVVQGVLDPRVRTT